MQHIMAEEPTEDPYAAPTDASRVKCDQSHRQRHRNWRQELVHALCYCSMVAPVPFLALEPRDPEDLR